MGKNGKNDVLSGEEVLRIFIETMREEDPEGELIIWTLGEPYRDDDCAPGFYKQKISKWRVKSKNAFDGGSR